jgi:uncharacterized membrane protein YfcA
VVLDVSATHLLILSAAGVGAGLTGSIAGLASLVSYPVLLSIGLTPLAANVTNTLALMGSGAGSAAGARRELRGQGGRLATLVLWMGIGGAIGSVLLLIGSSATFRVVVPWLVAFGALLLLLRDRLRGWLDRRPGSAGPDLGRVTRRRNLVPVVLTGVYAGYFGAGSGVIMLALLSLQTVEPLAVSNAVKNIANWAANAVAAVIFAIVAPVNWPAALALGMGALLGSSCGPAVVRVLPERPLRIAIAIAGLGLAVALFAGWPS